MRIDGNARTIRQLLAHTKYKLDYYQREYSWESKHVTELLDDLSKKFLESYTEGDTLADVPNYKHYFLGSIIISHSEGHRYIVDGQQRLTTLTLLLIRLYRSLDKGSLKDQVNQLIYSLSGGTEGFNLDVPEWCYIMEALYAGKSFDESGHSESIQNIALRYNDLEDYFEIQGNGLSLFAYWLLDNVYLVEIAAYDSRDAYAIFETVNDRGLSLTPADMLRGYLLSSITDPERRNQASEVWREHSQILKQIGKGEESEAIKAWLRSQYVGILDSSESVRDFDAIGSEFHRWVQNLRDELGLESSADFANFIERDFKFYASWYQRLRKAANSFTYAVEHELECVYYNAQNNFTLQYPVLLAPLRVEDNYEEALCKIQIGATYLDILIHRRIWNFQDISQRTMADLIPPVMPSIRSKRASELSCILHKRIEAEAHPFSNNDLFSLHGGNRRKIFLILARMTDYVGVQSAESSRYLEYMRTGKNRYEIEHIWANHLEHHADEFSHESELEAYRNRIGGLLLLPKSVNASSGDDPYAKKRKVYAGQNLLAKSLTEHAYRNNPGFIRFKENSGLQFSNHPKFKKIDLDTRQKLYLRLAEQIWNPERLRRIHSPEPVIVDELGGSHEGENKVNSESSVLVEDRDDELIQEWTEEEIKGLVSQELREHYETWHRNRVNEFYMRAADLKNFVEENGWQLELKFRKIYCSFYVGSRRVFGVQIDYAPPRFAVFMSEKEAECLSSHCEPEGYSDSRRYAFYPKGTTVEELRPILKSVYKKRRGD